MVLIGTEISLVLFDEDEHEFIRFLLLIKFKVLALSIHIVLLHSKIDELLFSEKLNEKLSLIGPKSCDVQPECHSLLEELPTPSPGLVLGPVLCIELNLRAKCLTDL